MALKELEKAVAKLSPEEVAAFREWFDRFDMDERDRQIARDGESGKLEKLIEQAKRDYADAPWLRKRPTVILGSGSALMRNTSRL